MAEKKKIFNESDFDKDKQLFTSEDFEKNKDVVKTPETSKAASSNVGRIVGGVIVAIAILAGVFFLVDNGSESAQPGTNKATTKQVVQATDGNTPKEAPTGNDVANGSESDNGVMEATSETSLVADSENDNVQANQSAAQPTVEMPDAKSSAPKQKPKDTVTKSQTSQANDSSAFVNGDVTENAIRVIRGDFGNGQVRKDKLGAAYVEIQSKVNEMYRNGLVK